MHSPGGKITKDDLKESLGKADRAALRLRQFSIKGHLVNTLL